ncbi:MAG: sodium:proline symporter [Solibacterales bacterium]|nr:sodium:proline symporter [Bryobacterales bacterium]|tara:strand:+ start:8241 stop:9671 length:1431 start_codon:yes stop_codon:yes gene_type:complete
MILSFMGFLLAFTLIGLSSAWQSRGTRHDYYLAQNTVKPWLVGLSAVASNFSGYMFIGLIGYCYATGLASIWMMVGWLLGDFLSSLFVHSRLHKATSNCDEVSYAGVLSNWYGGNNSRLQRLIGFVSLVFLLAYASAQLVAGGKALHVLFDWPTWAGIVMGAVLVTLYCFAGGIRASIWTDAAQSFVMILAMGLLLIVAMHSVGGINSAISDMRQVEGFLDWFPKDLAMSGSAGAVLFVVGWLFGGLSVIGQPHVMVRFMTLEDSGTMGRARLWYYLWFAAFYCLATGVGLLSRIYLTDVSNFDAELALPIMALDLLPPVLVGLILAGIFAATMSTADSLILSCSAAVTHDLLPRRVERPLLIKLTTIAITCCALGLALVNNQSVFSLVLMAWSALASAFAPLLIALCIGWKPGENLSIAAVITGLSVSLFWRWMGWHGVVYEGFPGIVAGLVLLALRRGEKLDSATLGTAANVEN